MSTDSGGARSSVWGPVHVRQRDDQRHALTQHARRPAYLLDVRRRTYRRLHQPDLHTLRQRYSTGMFSTSNETDAVIIEGESHHLFRVPIMCNLYKIYKYASDV